MRILLDENPCNVKADSVAQAIAAAAALAEKNGRMIVEVFVDGQQLTGDDLSRCDQDAAAGEVKLISANPNQLIAQTFHDASLALADADQLQQSSAELIQSNQLPVAMERLNQAISIWISVQQALVMGLELAGDDLADLASNLTTRRDDQLDITRMVDDLNAQLRTLQAALENRDTVALADALLYDLPQVVQQWRELLGDLHAHFWKRGTET